MARKKASKLGRLVMRQFRVLRLRKVCGLTQFGFFKPFVLTATDWFYTAVALLRTGHEMLRGERGHCGFQGYRFALVHLRAAVFNSVLAELVSRKKERK